MDDPELMAILRAEDRHYLNCIDLIAASNAPVQAVRSNADWGVAQFRSAEGHPGQRPYAGTRHFDELERLTARRAERAFGADHACVQPLSGTMANLAAFQALLSPGEGLLSMSMRSGGHLSHGHTRHLVSSRYRVSHYHVDRSTHLLDFHQIRLAARSNRPRVIVAGYSAYPRTVDFSAFAEIADEVQAVLVADISHIAGLVATGLHPNPCANGAVVSLSVEKTLQGTRGGVLLCPSRWTAAVDAAVFPGLQSSIGMASLVSLAHLLNETQQPTYRSYQEKVLTNARVLADRLLARGLPVVTQGTDTHLVLLNVGLIGLTGRECEQRLEAIGILSNRNSIPYDTRPAWEASGLRLGTPTITARGFNAIEVSELAEVIATLLLDVSPEDLQFSRLRGRVQELAQRPRHNDALLDLVQFRQPTVEETVA